LVPQAVCGNRVVVILESFGVDISPVDEFDVTMPGYDVVVPPSGATARSQ